MPKLSLKSDNYYKKPELKIYSLNPEDYHELVEEVNGAGKVKLDKGLYKVEAVDGERAFQKVVYLKNNLTVMMDFAEAYREIDVHPEAVKKALKLGIGIGATLIILLYLVGFRILSNYMTI